MVQGVSFTTSYPAFTSGISALTEETSSIDVNSRPIDGVNSSAANVNGGNGNIYTTGEFGTVTAPKINTETNAHQARTLTADDYETALAYVESGVSAVNPYSANTYSVNTVNTNYETRGEAWHGYHTPPNNGTGELICSIVGREDAIPDSPLPPQGLFA